MEFATVFDTKDSCVTACNNCLHARLALLRAETHLNRLAPVSKIKFDGETNYTDNAWCGEDQCPAGQRFSLISICSTLIDYKRGISLWQKPEPGKPRIFFEPKEICKSCPHHQSLQALA